jgi:hypothetical protein
MEIALHIVAGLVAGIVAALLHLWLARKAAESAARSASPASALLGFPVRVGVPATLLFGLALLSIHALVAGAIAFAVAHRLALRRSANEAGR